MAHLVVVVAAAAVGPADIHRTTVALDTKVADNCTETVRTLEDTRCIVHPYTVAVAEDADTTAENVEEDEEGEAERRDAHVVVLVSAAAACATSDSRAVEVEESSTPEDASRSWTEEHVVELIVVRSSSA